MTKTLLLLLTAMLAFHTFAQDSIRPVNPKSPAEVPFDSIYQQFFKKVSLKKPDFDSIEIPERKGFKQLKKESPIKDRISGTTGVGFEYGLLTAYLDTIGNHPLAVGFLDGEMSLQTPGIPLKVVYHYATRQNPLGVNNYFRVSADLQRYRMDQKSYRDELAKAKENQITRLRDRRDQMKGNVAYADLLKQRMKTEIANREAQYQQELSAYQLDSARLATGVQTRLGDSTATRQDSIRKILQEKQEQIHKYQLLYDSITRTYDRINTQYKLYDEQFKGKIAERDKWKSLAMHEAIGYGKGYLKHFTKLDIGLTYPNTTGLTNNSIPVKGIDFEVQKNNWYSAFTAGVTMNNLMVTPDAVQNKLNYSRNLFNQFDFQDIRQQRFVVFTKTGYGKKDETHAYIGMRYSREAIIQSTDETKASPAAGLELDLRWKPKAMRGTSVDVVYGKTSVYDSLLPQRNAAIQTLFSNSRSHTGLFRYEQAIHKLKTNISGSVRWIDPLADMASLGVLQPDNLRYEINTKHSLAKGHALNLLYRRDQDNVALTKDTTQMIQMLGGALSGRLLSKMYYFVNYAHLFQAFEQQSMISHGDENHTMAIGLTGNYQLKQVEQSLTLSFSDYQLTTQSGRISLKTYGLENLSSFEKLQQSFSARVFESKQADSASTQTLIIGDQLMMTKGKLRWTTGLKLAFSNQNAMQWGGKIGMEADFGSHWVAQIKAEKMVIGDFYNSYNPTLFASFPYAILTQINYKW